MEVEIEPSFVPKQETSVPVNVTCICVGSEIVVVAVDVAVVADVNACAAVSVLSDSTACANVETAAQERACVYSAQTIAAGETGSVVVTLQDEFQNTPMYDVLAQQERFYATATAGDTTIVCNAASPCMCSAVQPVEAGSFCVVNLKNGKFRVKYAFATAGVYSIQVD